MFKEFLTLFPHIDIVSNVVTDMISGEPMRLILSIFYIQAVTRVVYNLILAKRYTYMTVSDFV